LGNLSVIDNAKSVLSFPLGREKKEKYDFQRYIYRRTFEIEATRTTM